MRNARVTEAVRVSASLALYSGRGQGRGYVPESTTYPHPNPLPEYRAREARRVMPLTTLMMILAVGCVADTATKQNLTAGYTALDNRQFDEAIHRADEQLSRTPAGPGTAEALYLKGRAIEQRVKPDQQQVQSDLQQAREMYVEALQQQPSPTLDAYARTSLANIDYSMDDYAAAMQKWSDVYRSLEDNEVRSWVLYRIGLCQQRLGQFEPADRTFSTVIDTYPNTPAAERARQRMGLRSFAVQLATFDKPQAAEQAMQQLRKDGAVPQRLVDAQGHQVVTIGPAATYQQAKQLKSRYEAQYPYASIVP